MENIEQLVWNNFTEFFTRLDWMFMILFLAINYGVEKVKDFEWVRDLIKPSIRSWLIGGIIALFDVGVTFMKSCEFEIDNVYVIGKTYLLVIVFHDIIYALVTKYLKKKKKDNEDS